MFSHIISQTDVFPYRTENALSTDPENVITLFEASSVCRDKIVDNYSGDLGRTRRKNFKDFDIYHSRTKGASTLGISEESFLKVLKMLYFT